MHDSALLVEDVNVGAQQTGVCRHEHGVAPKLRRQDINIACSTARVCRGLCRDEDTRSNDWVTRGVGWRSRAAAPHAPRLATGSSGFLPSRPAEWGSGAHGTVRHCAVATKVRATFDPTFAP